MKTTSQAPLSFGALTAQLQQKAASVKAAHLKKPAAENDPDPTKDKTEEGAVTPPTDPEGQAPKTQVPANATNTPVTGTLPSMPVKTVEGPEKVAAKGLSEKAVKLAGEIRALAASRTKKAENTVGGDAGSPPTIPESKKNEGSGKGAPVAVPAGAGAAGDPAAKESEAAKAAADDLAGWDPAMHVKLAQLIVATEEGRSFAQQLIEREHGAEVARDTVKAACLMEEQARQLEDYEASGALLAEEMWKSASEEERARMTKLARVLEAGRAKYTTELEKLAYDAGAEAAAEMSDAGVLGEEAPADLSSAVIAALDEMVQAGDLTPEIAAQILQQLQGAEAGGDPMAGGDPAGGGGEMPPPGEEEAMSDGNLAEVDAAMGEEEPATA